MRRAAASVFRGAELALLYAASLLVPGAFRAEWLREWRAELWHVRHASGGGVGLGWREERQAAAFCVGAFADAGCLRREGLASDVPLATMTGSARRCLWRLSGVVAVSMGVALLLPGLRVKVQPADYHLPASLTLIRLSSDGRAPRLISRKQYLAWQAERQKLFDSFAFYQIAQVSLAGEQRQISVANASSNLLQMLHVPVRFTGEERRASGLPMVVLSGDLWRRRFGADEHVAGHIVRMGEQDAVIAGVVSVDAWKLPGKVDAWVLEAPGAAREDRGMGVVVAHLSPSAPHFHWGDAWTMTAPRPDGSLDDFECVTLWDNSTGVLGVFLCAVLLACLALPATTPLAMGEHLLSARRITWSTRLRRWGFLAGKVALLLPLVLFVSVDVAYARADLSATSAEYVQFATAFAVCLFGLRWALQDQRQRCPECLGKLTHPARVGQPSRNFLAWNGTELMCAGGHGLLHVPELATSWFSTQRWMYLDASWEILFASGYL